MEPIARIRGIQAESIACESWRTDRARQIAEHYSEAEHMIAMYPGVVLKNPNAV